MNIISGLMYNIKGFWLGVKTPRLLLLGLLRFAIVALIAVLLSGLILDRHADILALLWQRPESQWIVWLWYLASWLLTVILMGISAVVAYLVAQVLFAVFIMDLMCRITERLVSGQPAVEPAVSFLARMSFLIRQELPRNIIPVLLTLLLMVLGWFTPLGPLVTVAGPLVAVIFLAWDNTDLIPARQLQPFGERFRTLVRTPLFHLGFGLPFLIPGLNLLFLSFAPVGATLYHMECKKKAEPQV
jgi:CysZ protein